MHVSRMLRRTVALALLFLTCVLTAPVPGQTKVTLIRNSSFGFGLAAGNSNTSGVVEGNRSVDVNLPGNVEERAPDVTILENVNSGASVAIGGSRSFGVIKDNVLAGKNPFWMKK